MSDVGRWEREMDVRRNLAAERLVGQLGRGQSFRLEALIRAADQARPEAKRGLLFASPPGRALVNAAFDLFECDALYWLGQDVEHELQQEGEG
jgi:hypothetical protein